MHDSPCSVLCPCWCFLGTRRNIHFSFLPNKYFCEHQIYFMLDVVEDLETMLARSQSTRQPPVWFQRNTPRSKSLGRHQQPPGRRGRGGRAHGGGRRLHGVRACLSAWWRNSALFSGSRIFQLWSSLYMCWVSYRPLRGTGHHVINDN